MLEKKPEEKIWKVVRENVCPEMDVPCYRLNKKDLIKVGRVRFKIRDIMSPVYYQIGKFMDNESNKFKSAFPSMNESNVSQVSVSCLDSVADEEPD